MGSDYKASPNIIKTNVYLGDQAADHAVITGTLAIDGKVGIETHAPNSTMQVSGSLALGYREVTEDMHLTGASLFLITTANGVTLTLPAASTMVGRVIVIKDSIDRTDFNPDKKWKIGPQGTDELESFNAVIPVGLGYKVAINVFSNGTGWHIW